MKKRLFIVVNDVLPLLDTRAAEGNNTVVGTEPNLKKYDKDTKILTIANRGKAYQSFEEVTKIKEENVKFTYDEVLEVKSIVF